MYTVLDHIVFGAASLEAGVSWLEQVLGVPLSPGGQHFKMGTHNCLLRIGERTYLEIIAIDPSGTRPQRPRWFGLDGFTAQDLSPVRLLTWAAGTDDIESSVKRSVLETGPAHAMSRNAINWLITIPDDGNLVENGAMPSLIQWLGGVHPTNKLPFRGVKLESLRLLTPDPNAMRAALRAISFDITGSVVEIVPAEKHAGLEVVLSTPQRQRLRF